MLSKFKFEFNASFHALLGVLGANFPKIVPIWVIYIIVVEGLYKPLTRSGSFFKPHFAAAYLCGLEMIARMSRSGLPHELTKYAVIVVLTIGILNKKQPINKKVYPIIVFILILVPSLAYAIGNEGFEMARQHFSFNLSGPLCLAVATIYFYNLALTDNDLKKLMQYILYPIISTIFWLFISTPDVAEIDFHFGANFIASGYGPNQMASLLGFTILIIGFGIMFNLKISNIIFTQIIIIVLSLYRGLLTFSRGGMMGPVIVLIIIYFYSIISRKDKGIKINKSIIKYVLFILVFYFTISFVNDSTDGQLYNRYIGISNDENVDSDKYSSGRIQIAEIDWEIFKDYPIFGVGPGLATELRYQYGYVEAVAAHIEFTRLLAEHGVFGLISLSILVFFPFFSFFKIKNLQQRSLLLMGVLFCFVFMSHSATRIALPVFVFGLGFASLYKYGHEN